MAEEVFTLLELDQKTDRTPYIKLLTIWVEYLEGPYANYMMSDVIAAYDDVETRVMILDGLSEIKGTEVVVEQVQNYMVESWFRDKKSAEDLFTTLQLDKGGSKSNFDMWAKYVVKAPDTLQATKSAITKLSGRHDDEDLLKMFDSFAKAEANKDVLTTLESALMASWKDKKMSAVAVFKLLKLDQKNDYVLRNEVLREAKFGVWVQYAAKEPNELSSTTIEMVSKHYGDVGLLKIFEAFAKAEASKEVLLPLKSALMASWKANKRWAKDIFKLLKLDQKTDHTLYINRLTIWVEYLKNGPNGNILMMIVIADYGDIETCVMILDGLSEIEGTEVVVEQVQYSMVISWFRDKKSAEDLFTTLQLDKGGSKSNFDMWAKYVVKAPDTLQATKSAITKLSGRHDDEDLLKMFDSFAKAKANKDVLTTLESTLMASWKDKEMSAEAVFKLLKLDQKTDHTLYINRLSMWVEYFKNDSNASISMKRVTDSDDDVKIRVTIVVGLSKFEALIPL